jgi:dihydroorotate dehydrogenase
MPGADLFLRSQFAYCSPRLRLRVSGIDFENPLGMAAGFDKTGALFPFLSCMGFGFVESGTFTRHAQSGNPKPRVFRIPEARALVNRMGFNNPGADGALCEFKKQKKRAVRGINIGKSKITDLDQALDDYLYSLRTLLPYADYIAVNVSSPNTPGLRLLQEKARLVELLSALKKECTVPLYLKIAPDLSEPDLFDAVDAALDYANGLIVCNTTIDRSMLPAAAGIEGGLSGAPLRQRSLELLSTTAQRVKGRIPVISVGGIDSAESALERFLAGASLVQIYTSYIYEGPELPRRILKGLDESLEKMNVTLQDVVNAGGRI